MTRRRGRTGGLAGLAVVLVLITSACDSSAQEPAAGATEDATGPSSPTSTPTGSPSPQEDAAPSPGSMETPSTRSGDLTRALFPTPDELGAGWRYRVDAGDPEEGYTGNGTPVLARDPDEVATTAVPFGCRVATPLPRPTHALEVDYHYRGRSVVAVRSTFASVRDARTYFGRRSAAVAACEGDEIDAATGPLVAGVRTLPDRTVVNQRTPQSQPWTELATLTGRDVVLVAVQGASLDLDPGRTSRLFRSPAPTEEP